MKYFVNDGQRESTCYHEFYKGKWDGHTFWKADSILLHDNFLCESKGFVEAIMEVIPTYTSYENIEISFGEWKEIGKIISQKDTVSQEVYKEADDWLKDVFETHECFTILGI